MESKDTRTPARPPAFEADLLNREPEARSLTKLLERIDSPFVIAIAGKWGTGKTTFFDIWEKHLQSEGIKYQRFNAWENDYHDDPLIPFIGSIAAELSQSKKERLSNKAARVAITMGPHLARLLTSGIINLKDESIDNGVGFRTTTRPNVFGSTKRNANRCSN